MAPTTRRRIGWVVGAFALLEVLRFVIAGIAGYVAWVNLSDLAKDGLGQTQAAANARIHAAGQAATVTHLALADPLISWVETSPHLGTDLRVADVAMEATSRVAPTIARVLAEIPGDQRLSDVKPATLSADLVYQTIGQVGDALRPSNHELSRINLKSLDFGIGSKLARALPALHLVAYNNQQLQALASAALVVAKSGQTHPAYWFLANQNLAEARGTGGLIGSYAVVMVNRGKISLASSGSDQNLNAMGPVIHQALPLDSGAIWQDDPTIWQDLNASAHTPYAAQQIADTWLTYKHQHLDGVVFMGQGVAQFLVAAFGPVKIAGVQLNEANTADFLAKGVYAKYTKVDDKNQAVQKFMTQIFAASRDGKPNLNSLIGALAKPRTGDQLNIWSFDNQQQTWNENHGIAGDVSTKPSQDVTLAINNGGGNKLEAYLHTDADYTFCKASRQAHLQVKLANVAPRYGLPAYVIGRNDLPPGTTHIVGSNLETITVYLPLGSQLESLLVDGDSFGAGSATDRGHQILNFNIEINPGQSHKIDIDWLGAKAVGTKTKSARVLTRPMFNPARITYPNKGCN